MSVNRREFVRRLIVSSGLLLTGVVGFWELLQELPNKQAQTVSTLVQPDVTVTKTVTVRQPSTSGQQSASKTQTSSTAQGAPAGYILVAPLSALSGKTSAYFQHPRYGLSLLVNSGGMWRAFSATCTHAPCTVQYGGNTIQCPCHNGSFSPTNGAVLGGPPPSPLPEYGVLVQSSNVYVSN